MWNINLKEPLEVVKAKDGKAHFNLRKDTEHASVFVKQGETVEEVERLREELLRVTTPEIQPL